MTKAHIGKIMPIEKASFPSPWSEALYKGELRLPGTRAYIARERGRGQNVLGYIMCRLVLDELHIMSIAVHPSHLRKKVGSNLFLHCIENNPQAKVVYLEVRESNRPARSFYRKMGFSEIGRRRRYYSDTGEDAIVMAWNVD